MELLEQAVPMIGQIEISVICVPNVDGRARKAVPTPELVWAGKYKKMLRRPYMFSLSILAAPISSSLLRPLYGLILKLF